MKRFAPRPISIEEEIQLDMLRFRNARKQAEEIVLDRGWTREDEDFEFQVEQEAKVQWEEDCEQDRRWQELAHEEEYFDKLLNDQASN